MVKNARQRKREKSSEREKEERSWALSILSVARFIARSAIAKSFPLRRRHDNAIDRAPATRTDGTNSGKCHRAEITRSMRAAVGSSREIVARFSHREVAIITAGFSGEVSRRSRDQNDEIEKSRRDTVKRYRCRTRDEDRGVHRSGMSHVRREIVKRENNEMK